MLYVGLPNGNERRTILEIHRNKMPWGSDVDLGKLVDATEGANAASLVALCQAAAIRTMQRIPVGEPVASQVRAGEEQTHFGHCQHCCDQLTPSFGNVVLVLITYCRGSRWRTFSLHWRPGALTLTIMRRRKHRVSLTASDRQAHWCWHCVSLPCLLEFGCVSV